MIDVAGLTKRYGEIVAVDDLTFRVRPGIVTGFLGPNGAGKSTTMRMILGLDEPSAGGALIGGRPLASHPSPLRSIGSLLEARAIHPRRSARNHLRALAVTNAIPASRVDAVLSQVGLIEVADRSGGGFSLGMGQRLGIAAALLGDPEVIMLDEPVNGLDPEGILWIRNLLQDLAREGRTVFVSSHLMSEMELMADHFVIVGAGRLIADVSSSELHAMASASTVTVGSLEMTRLVDVLRGPDVEIVSITTTTIEVTGLTVEMIGVAARDAGVALTCLAPHQTSLEEIFMQLTHHSVQYNAAPASARKARDEAGR